MKLAALVAAVAASLVVIGMADPGRQRATVEADDHVASFLAGRWVSQEFGWAEAMWMPAQDDRVVGVFRWHDAEGNVIVHELLSIAAEEGETVMRMRHFDAALDPWAQESDGPIRFVLVESSERLLVWETEGDDPRVERYEQQLMTMEGGRQLLRSRVTFPEASGQPMLELTMASVQIDD